MKLALRLTFFVFLIIAFNQNIFSQDHFGLLKSPPSGSENVIKIDANDNIFLGVWGYGIKRSNDNGASWTDMNSGLTNKYVTDIDFTENGGLFATTFGGGVFYSFDGSSWNQKNNGIKNLNATSVKVLNDGRVIIGTYGSGMYLSSDNGDTWTESNKGFDFRDVRAIGEFETTGFITAGTYGGATYMTRDSGNTWKWEKTGMTNFYVNEFAFNDNGEILAATNGRGLLYSVNSGVSYTEYDSLMRSEFVSQAEPLPDYNFTCVIVNSMNEPVVGTRNHGIFKYDRFTWNHWYWTAVRTDGITDMAMNSSGVIFAASINNEIYKSENMGENWSKISDIMDDDITYIYPFDGMNTYLAKGNELYISDDYGYNWSKQGDLPQLGSLIVKDSAGVIYTGGQGLHRSFDGGTTFSAFGYNDTIINGLSVGSDNTLYIAWSKANEAENPDPPSWQGIDFVTSTQKGRVETLSDPINSIVADGLGGLTYADNKGTLSRTTDKGNTWNSIFGFSGKPQKIYYDHNNHLYILSDEGIFYSQNLGNTWTEFDFDIEGKENEKYVDIFVTPQDRIYLKVNAMRSVFGYNQIYYTDDPTEGEWVRADQSVTQSGFIDVKQNIHGDVYVYSNMLYKAFNPHTIEKPEILSPAEGEFVSSLNPEIVWEPAFKAEMYELEVSTKPNYTFRISNVFLSDTTHVIFDTLEHNVTYYYRIRSKTHDAYSDWTEGTFTTSLQEPKLEYPANDSLCVSRFAELSWFESDGAAEYIVHLSDSVNFSNLIVEDTVAITNYPTPELMGYTEYYWRIKAINEDTQSAWSEVRRFRTVLSEPELMYPMDGELNIALKDTFRFKTDYSSDLYNYAFIEIMDMDGNPVDSNLVLSDSTFVTDSLAFNMTYQWRAGIVTDCDEVIYSEYYEFSTLLEPVVLLMPENGAENLPVDITLEWQKHTELNTYHLMVATDADFNDIIDENDALTELKYDLTGLQNNSVYYWKIMAYDETLRAEWSETWSFVTVLTRPQLRLPLDSAQNVSLTPNMLWFGVEGAEYYQLQVAKDINFDDLIFSQDSIYDVQKQLDMLEQNTWYFWRVRAISETGTTDWSEIWAFRTSDGTPQLVYPEDGAENIVFNETFRWSSVPDAIAYQLQIARDMNFDDLIISTDELTETFYDAVFDEYEQTYYWRVKAIFEAGESEWSEVWSFTTEPENSVFEFISDDMRIYPNPASDIINMDINILRTSAMRIYIIDMSGRHIQSIGTDSMLPGYNAITFNVSQLSQGTYFIIIEADGYSLMKEFKVIK
jgi:photosystem II stability/assembly factor-like uncharacterized protein